MNRSSAALTVAILMTATTTSSTRAQTASTPPVAPTTAAPKRIVLSPDVLRGLPRRSITVTEEHGTRATYDGVDLGAVLAKEDVPQGAAVRGAVLAQYVLLIASDGYRVVFALPELDRAFTDRAVLLVDRRNGSPLPPHLAPFRIIVPDEKRQARWIHSVTEIDIETAP